MMGLEVTRDEKLSFIFGVLAGLILLATFYFTSVIVNESFTTGISENYGLENLPPFAESFIEALPIACLIGIALGLAGIIHFASKWRLTL